MPDANGNLVPGDAGYVAPVTGTINTLPVPPAPQQAVASTPKSEAFTVAPEATVASNVKNLIDADSPLMQQAATRAANQANARGLLNSSIAISAGHSALYDAALPIAQADAATHARAAENTTLAKNAAEAQRANIETSTSQFNVNAANTQQLQQNEAAVRVALQKLQSDTTLTGIDKQIAGQKVISEADNVARAAIAKLQADTTLSAADKQIAANEILSLRDTETKLAMQEFQLGADLQKINADGTIRQGLADTEASYKILMQTQAGASDLYKQALSNFAAIIANPDIADKTAALNLGVKQLNDGLKLIGDVANLDLGSYLTFGEGADGTPVATNSGGTSTGTSTTSTSTGTSSGGSSSTSTGTSTSAPAGTTTASDTGLINGATKPPYGGPSLSQLIADKRSWFQGPKPNEAQIETVKQAGLPALSLAEYRANPNMDVGKYMYRPMTQTGEGGMQAVDDGWNLLVGDDGEVYTIRATSTSKSTAARMLYRARDGRPASTWGRSNPN